MRMDNVICSSSIYLQSVDLSTDVIILQPQHLKLIALPHLTRLVYFPTPLFSLPSPRILHNRIPTPQRRVLYSVLFSSVLLLSIMDGKKKKITNYTILLDKMLGEGASGKVYVGEQDNTKLKVAIKILEKKTVDRDYYLKSSLFSEIEILKSLKCPNVVGFLDVMESKHCYYIIQEFCDGGELRGLMKKRGKLSEKQAIGMLKQICNGFVQLIKEGVMHRDLKPENILIHQGVLKLADFGFSKKDRAKKMAAQTMVGTPLYMSIQILKGLPYSSKCDIWALGCIFFELLYGRTPWIGNSEYELIRNVETTPLRFPYEVSKVTKDFISKCVAKDENKRFSWDELLRHEIFQGYFIKKEQMNKQFQNKYKAIMNNMRQQVKENQIDLESNFQKQGVGKGSSITIGQFEVLLKSVDQKITQQEIGYIFNKIAVHGSKTISYDEFQKALQKSGIPMSMIRKVDEKVGNQASDPFGPMGGGLYDLLVNQVVNPNEQTPYFKSNQNPLQPQLNNQNLMNQQMAMMQQQQQQMFMGMGLGGMGRLGGMNGFGGLNGMNGFGGMRNFGQLGGFGGGFGGGQRGLWM